MIRGRVVRTQHPGSSTRVLQGSLLKHVGEIGPRSPDVTHDYGRCHLPNSPIFYAAFNEDTVLAELKPELYDLVYFLYCRPADGASYKSVTIGEIDHIRRYGRGSIFTEESPNVQQIKRWLAAAEDEDDYVRIVTDAFLAKFISRVCANQEDYRAVSALSGVLLKHKVDQPGVADAIYYPSVAHLGGINVAISLDTYETGVIPYSCKVVHVQNNLGFGVYKTLIVTESEKINSDGSITWKPGMGMPNPIPKKDLPFNI